MINQIIKQNYFELFSLSKQFGINLNKLQERFTELQKQFHPDNFIGKDPALANQALMASSQINQAYVTLKEPLSRAIYLLQLQGIKVDLVHDTKFTSEFLMAQIELREEISDAKDKADIDKLEEIEADLHCKRQNLIKEINSLFEMEDKLVLVELIKMLSFYDKLDQLVINTISQL
jgi:molecular chaperone HscB